MVLNITYDASRGMVVTNADGVQIEYNLADMAWLMAAMALVFFMIPGAGYFYSGLLRKKNALSMLWTSMLSIAIVSLQWFFWGYSLTFADNGGPFIGTLKFFGLRNVLAQPTHRVPTLLFSIYQLMFAAVTLALAVGAIAERGRLGPTMVFMFIWTTIVYDPIAYWTWNSNGWSAKLGILDFAGGTPVHICSGTAALAISISLGRRTGYERLVQDYKPHNTSYVVLGTVFLWFGWFGFNGGSAGSASLRAVQACVVTNLAASMGGITWVLWDYHLGRRWTIVGFCSGAISGLVTITPGSGYVGAPAAVLFGFMAGTLCRFATKLKFIFGYDDALDIFATHAIGGITGNVLTGFFAEASIASFDGFTVIEGGWIDHNYKQLGIQLADSAAGFVWSFVMTTIILWIMNFTPLHLRPSEQAEIDGIDEAEMGEFAYEFVVLEQETAHTVDTGLPLAETENPSSIRMDDLAESSGVRSSACPPVLSAPSHYISNLRDHAAAHRALK